LGCLFLLSLRRAYKKQELRESSKSSGNLGGARFPELHAQVALNFFNSLLH